jgi:hypothetical protein
LKIVSGGQTGADRAALDAALDAGVPCGGWCPADRSAEDGVIPPRYPVMPLPAAGNDERTRRNVLDSDGTVIISFGPLTGGSETTRLACIEFRKPHVVIDAKAAKPHAAAEAIVAFIERYDVHVLNIAGPQTSEQPDIGQYVYQTVRRVLASS